METCNHERVETRYTGGYHFYAGEVWDDIREELFCLDCQRILTAAEARAWRKRHLPAPQANPTPLD